MIAFYKIIHPASENVKIVTVDGVRDQAHAATLQAEIKARHAARVVLLSLEDSSLHYAAVEISTEKELFGRGWKS